MANAKTDPASEPTGDAAASGPIVVFDDVSIGFDGKEVLKNISFQVDRGQTLIILGPAGCGKSVLMKLANGLMTPDSGDIHIFGLDIVHMREQNLYKLRERIGMVFQESALFDSLSVEENVAYRLHEERMPEDQAHAKVSIRRSTNIRRSSRAACAAVCRLPAPSSRSPT
jgi:phospholipid/cholesterol/gamma-HCH transport system ATP-binding protein